MGQAYAETQALVQVRSANRPTKKRPDHSSRFLISFKQVAV